MTDGRSYDRVGGPGQLFRRRNIICYAVGIGRKFNKRQLLQIAAGNRRRVVTAGFRSLKYIAGTIARGACTGKDGRLLKIKFVNVPLISIDHYCDCNRNHYRRRQHVRRLLRRHHRDGIVVTIIAGRNSRL